MNTAQPPRPQQPAPGHTTGHEPGHEAGRAAGPLPGSHDELDVPTGPYGRRRAKAALTLTGDPDRYRRTGLTGPADTESRRRRRPSNITRRDRSSASKVASTATRLITAVDRVIDTLGEAMTNGPKSPSDDW